MPKKKKQLGNLARRRELSRPARNMHVVFQILWQFMKSGHVLLSVLPSVRPIQLSDYYVRIRTFRLCRIPCSMRVHALYGILLIEILECKHWIFMRKNYIYKSNYFTKLSIHHIQDYSDEIIKKNQSSCAQPAVDALFCATVFRQLFKFRVKKRHTQNPFVFDSTMRCKQPVRIAFA